MASRLPDPLGHLQPVDAGQQPVEHHEAEGRARTGRVARVEQRERLLAAGARDARDRPRAEQRLEQFPAGVVVLDDEHRTLAHARRRLGARTGGVRRRATRSVAVKVNVVPTPGALSNARSPPISRASRRLIASPSPVPPYLRDVELSACVNAPNSRPCCSGGMPMPVSRTLMRSGADAGLRAGAASRRLDPHHHLAALGELERIAHQVGEHLPHAEGVADEPVGHVGRHVRDQLHVLLDDLGAEGLGHLVEHGRAG